MNVWPFIPREEFLETAEWSTDVIQSKTGEQRIALRSTPITNFRFEHTFSAHKYTLAQSLIEDAGVDTLYIPDWTARRIADATPSGDTIDCDSTGIEAGDEVILWASDVLYERFTVDSVTSTSITAENAFVKAYAVAPYVIPVRLGRAVEGLKGTRLGANIVNAQVEFEMVENYDAGDDIGLPTYLSKEVLINVPLLGSGLSTEVMREAMRVDNPLGTSFMYPEFDRARKRFTMAWHDFTPEEILTTKQFVYSRRGKQKEFWLPTYDQDVRLTANIAGLSITIEPAFIVGNPENLHLMVQDGSTKYYTRVTEVAASGANQILTINTNVGNIPKENGRVSLLTLARFDSDRVEFLNRNGLGVSVTVPCVSV